MKKGINPEQQLVRDIKSGDASAFDTLYWKYHKAVYFNILRLIKDPDTSKDILQEVFITLWIKRNTLSPEMRIGGWLFTTSYHKCIDHLRLTIAESLWDGEVSIADEWIDLRKEKEQESRLQLIQQAVHNLSPKKRAVFELCKLKGKTYEETARELNISKYTVKEYLSAAIIYIKNYIHRQPQSPVSILLILSAFYPPFF
ncbi:MAG: sigma-70 family RNA polymerase sigma factor [Sphingobacteriales bacterium]|nr:sigma-70 family RNA polymerase sigma factor [Sphingobacteriales bacterium]